MKDVEELFRELGTYAEFIVFTYNSIDASPKRERHWISHLSEQQILEILDRQDLQIESRSSFGPGQRLLFRVHNRTFSDDAKRQRGLARSEYVILDRSPHWWERFRHNVMTADIFSRGPIKL